MASTGRSCSRNPSRPLLGSPIELIRPGGVSHRRGRGVAAPGSERDGLRHEGREREALAQRVPEGAQRRDRVEGARSRSGPDAQARSPASSIREVDAPRRRGAETPRQCQSSASSAAAHDRPVDAQPPVAGRVSHDAAEAGAEAACHAGLQRELRLDRRARRRSAAPPRASAAGRMRRPRRSAASSLLEQVGDESVVRPGPCRRRSRPRRRPGAGARPARTRRCETRAATALGPRRAAPRAQITSGAMPMPPPTSSARPPSGGRVKPMPSGPDQPQPRSPARAPPAAPCRARSPRAGTRAGRRAPGTPRRPGPGAGAPTRRPSPRRRPACRTARRAARARPGPRPRPGRRGRSASFAATRQSRRPNGARVRGPCSAAASPGSSSALTRLTSAAGSAGVGRPACRAAPGASVTVSADSRAAPIARAAADAPVIVVMHGMPRLDRGPADLPPVRARAAPDGRVDHDVHVAAADPVGDVRRSLADLVQLLHRGAHLRGSRPRCRCVASTRKPRSCMRAASCVAAGLSVSQTEMKTLPSRGQRDARARPAPCRTPSGKSSRDAHHLAGGLHLRAQQRVAAVQALERQHRLLHAHVVAARARAAGPGRRGARPGSGGRRPWRAARRSPWRRTAPCATRAGWPRSRTGGRCRRARTARSGARSRPAAARSRASGGAPPRACPRRGSAAAARRRSRRSAPRPPRRAA